jgi:hypothetical protein
MILVGLLSSMQEVEVEAQDQVVLAVLEEQVEEGRVDLEQQVQMEQPTLEEVEGVVTKVRQVLMEGLVS